MEIHTVPLKDEKFKELLFQYQKHKDFIHELYLENSVKPQRKKELITYMAEHGLYVALEKIYINSLDRQARKLPSSEKIATDQESKMFILVTYLEHAQFNAWETLIIEQHDLDDLVIYVHNQSILPTMTKWLRQILLKYKVTESTAGVPRKKGYYCFLIQKGKREQHALYTGRGY